MKTLHDQYGDVVRIAPDELSFIDSTAWKAIYVSNGPSITQSNDADHSRYRRLLSHGFSDSSLRGQEPIIKSYIDLLIRRLHERSVNGQLLNLVSWYNFTTFDIIGDLAFGESFNCLDNSDYHDWVKLIFANSKFSAYINVARRLPGTKFLVKLITPKRVFAQKEWHRQMSREKVMSRLEKSNERPDFYANIIKHHGTEKGLSVEEMISTGATLIVAGSETTATVLSGVTYLLLKNPRVLEKLQNEVRSAFSSEEQINFDSCNKLEYCLAVLTEALRVYPPVAPGLPRIVDPQGDMIAGNWVPGGTIVSVPHLAAYHSERNFTDAEQFIPERHLGDPRYANDNTMVMQPFSFGPRNCIGRNLAFVEMRIILARMIFNFDMELDPSTNDWLDQNSYFLLYHNMTAGSTVLFPSIEIGPVAISDNLSALNISTASPTTTSNRTILIPPWPWSTTSLSTTVPHGKTVHFTEGSPPGPKCTAGHHKCGGLTAKMANAKVRSVAVSDAWVLTVMKTVDALGMTVALMAAVLDSTISPLDALALLATRPMGRAVYLIVRKSPVPVPTVKTEEEVGICTELVYSQPDTACSTSTTKTSTSCDTITACSVTATTTTTTLTDNTSYATPFWVWGPYTNTAVIDAVASEIDAAFRSAKSSWEATTTTSSTSKTTTSETSTSTGPAATSKSNTSGDEVGYNCTGSGECNIFLHLRAFCNQAKSYIRGSVVYGTTPANGNTGEYYTDGMNAVFGCGVFVQGDDCQILGTPMQP
ncbi:hypothetical protein PVAR5_4236 [Paecilomyces variotii No. 5]|uniref:Cytochrome P450 n=1 Tax=Byssochlamys spectabilis (strain No. 5 / NBRC 109023) TaxID=1356009 RepID=V5HZU1_BYSSN|nr:hypothetical protein PVAR5_4236 [Paecilomyces variotii No. 5]